MRFAASLFAILAVLLVVFARGATPVLAKEDPRLALVIANANYVGGMDPLANPLNDGRLVETTLKALGFQVTLISDADQRAMKRAISDFGEALETAGPKTTALFYYAGHGLQVDGQNYLVPVTADIRREADVDLEAVSAEAVLKQMEYAAPHTSIVILDACRNNPLTRSARSGARGLARMDAPNGSFVAYSTAPGQVAADGDGVNSPFAVAFAAEVTRPNQAIEESFRNIRVRVAQATSGQQTPWDSSSLMAPFYFAGKSAAGAQVASVSNPPVDAARDQQFWDNISNSQNAGDYAAYLAAFPNGNFVKLAESRMAGLQQSASRTTSGSESMPQYESPLPDGTIILSRQVSQAMNAFRTYAHKMTPQVGVAYFYVSPDGRHHGDRACTFANQPPVIGTSTCPKGSGQIGKRARFARDAQQKCESEAGTECVQLFDRDEAQVPYKTIDDMLAGN